MADRAGVLRSELLYEEMLAAPTSSRLESEVEVDQGAFNPAFKSVRMLLSNDDDTATQGINGSYPIAGGLIGRSTGKYVAAFHLENVPNNATIGVARGTHALGDGPYLGDSSGLSVGYWLNGQVYRNGAVLTTYASYAVGAIVHLAVDLDTHRLWFGVNGTWSGDPGAGTGAVLSDLASAEWFFAVSLAGNLGGVWSALVEPGAYPYALPADFVEWNAD